MIPVSPEIAAAKLESRPHNFDLTAKNMLHSAYGGRMGEKVYQGCYHDYYQNALDDHFSDDGTTVMEGVVLATGTW